MSNLKINICGREFTGLAVKLVDGLLVSGNSHIICHGTTASEFDGSIFGIQFAANCISMGSKMEVND